MLMSTRMAWIARRAGNVQSEEKFEELYGAFGS